MGTSSSFGGAGGQTPLLPSWAEDLPAWLPVPPTPVPDNPQPATVLPPATPNPIASPIPLPLPTPDRFRVPRSNFTRFIASGGTNRQALGRAIGGQIRGISGGAKTAARRMATSRRAASNLLGVLRDIQTQGTAQVLKSLSLDFLAGQTPKEILAAFIDTICSPGGTIDEGIARDAYIETILELNEAGLDLDAITTEQINLLTISFISRSIVNRVINDVGQTMDVRVLSAENANYLTQFIADWINGAVRDALEEKLTETRALAKPELDGAMARIYEQAYEIIEIEAERLV